MCLIGSAGIFLPARAVVILAWWSADLFRVPVPWYKAAENFFASFCRQLNQIIVFSIGEFRRKFLNGNDPLFFKFISGKINKMFRRIPTVVFQSNCLG